MKSDSAKQKVMLVGVVPPPVHGQSIATKALFDADLSPIEKILLPIRSSKSIDTVGKLSLSKALSLFPLILKAWLLWLWKRPQTLYYTAGSGAWVPFTRDFLFLALCRPLFKRTVIHYHSGNLVEFLEASPLRSKLGQFTYGRGACTIRLGKYCPAPIYPGNQVFDVPNGIDVPEYLPERTESDTFRILFLGNLFIDKGVLDLISAVTLLGKQSPEKNFKLSLIGGWPDETTRSKIENAISELPSNVDCPPPAPAYGDEKWKALRSHDVFAFPSYYSSENLPLVIIEAMAAGLPVIASDWRGIKSLVEDGKTGLLVKPSDINQLAAAIDKMASDQTLRRNLTIHANKQYVESLTKQIHLNKICDILQ
ncbi:glycosyltransferase family 4 protein [Luteolibacter algae]|uniref:Glycosyltransferase family 4 protein n=1 Tax=Luteolibacter algae TaxID=454151 RepID=A0ABW5D538_9BACT